MATRIPLVIVNGQMQQLQSGDQIQVASAIADTRTLTSGEISAASTLGTPVYSSASGAFKRAQSNAISTSRVIGLVYDSSIASAASGQVVVSGVCVGTTVQWDAVTGQTGGLTFGAAYYVDPVTVGKLTSTAPTTPGQIVAPVGVALSLTDMEVLISASVLL